MQGGDRPPRFCYTPAKAAPYVKEYYSDMKITCPKCSATGNLPEHEIPSEGRFLNCPRCKHGFTVTKPRSGSDSYLVDTCPACNFSTFGEENFGTCPKCGILVKAFVERQREEQLQQRNQELLTKKLSNNDIPAPLPEEKAPSVGDMLENLHPVNLIGYGVTLAAVVILGLGLWGIIEIDTTKIREQLIEQREEQVSSFYVFLHYSMDNWLKVIYGLVACYVAYLFMQRRKTSLRMLEIVLWCAIVYVPLSHVVSFVFWVMAPIPHAVSGYLIELFNMVFMSALIGVPLFILIRFLQERKITSVVKL